MFRLFKVNLINPFSFLIRLFIFCLMSSVLGLVWYDAGPKRNTSKINFNFIYNFYFIKIKKFFMKYIFSKHIRCIIFYEYIFSYNVNLCNTFLYIRQSNYVKRNRKWCL